MRNMDYSPTLTDHAAGSTFDIRFSDFGEEMRSTVWKENLGWHFEVE